MCVIMDGGKRLSYSERLKWREGQHMLRDRNGVAKLWRHSIVRRGSEESFAKLYHRKPVEEVLVTA